MGGQDLEARNIIAYNKGNGVVVVTGTQNAILTNSIFTNSGLGIDLARDGVTPNDPGDPDTGPNNLQNFPVLANAIVNGVTATIAGTLNSTPNTSDFRVEFFLNSVSDPSGHGEGRTFLGTDSVDTDANGDATIQLVDNSGQVTDGSFISATATDPSGNTSEFSATVVAVGGSQPITVSFQDGVDGYSGTRDTWLHSNQPTSNFGSAVTLEVDGSPDQSILLAWDVTSIPAGSSIQSVDITVDVTNTSSQDYEFYELNRPWVENEATFNEYASGQSWQVAGADGSSDRGSTVLGAILGSAKGPFTVGLSAAGVAVVQGWVDTPSSNNGFILLDYITAVGFQIHAISVEAVDHESPHSAVSSGYEQTIRVACVSTVQFNQQGWRPAITAGTGLGQAVDNHRVGDGRQGRSRTDGMGTPSRDDEFNDVRDGCAGIWCGVGLVDGISQGAGSGIIGVGDGEAGTARSRHRDVIHLGLLVTAARSCHRQTHGKRAG